MSICRIIDFPGTLSSQTKTEFLQSTDQYLLKYIYNLENRLECCTLKLPQDVRSIKMRNIFVRWFGGFFAHPPPPSGAVCLNIFYFGVNGARLIFCQISLTCMYKRPDLLSNSNSHDCQEIFLLLSGNWVGQCPLTASIVLVISSPNFSQFLSCKTTWRTL